MLVCERELTYYVYFVSLSFSLSQFNTREEIRCIVLPWRVTLHHFFSNTSLLVTEKPKNSTWLHLGVEPRSSVSTVYKSNSTMKNRQSCKCSNTRTRTWLLDHFLLLFSYFNSFVFFILLCLLFTYRDRNLTYLNNIFYLSHTYVIDKYQSILLSIL